MAAQTLEELKAAMSKSSSDNSNESYDSKWKSFFRFYQMKFDETSIVRFLPDLDETNPGFLYENIKHSFLVNGKRRDVPCLSMWKESCPCCILSAKYYAEEGDDSKNGQMFYKKREWIGKVLVKHHYKLKTQKM
jgi:hypothetical protein